MAFDPPPLALAQTEDAWHELDLLVEGLADMAKSDLPPGEFYAELLDRTVSALGAIGGGVWTRGADSRCGQECQLNATHPWLTGAGEEQPPHSLVIEEVLKAGKARLVSPHRQPTREDAACNPTGLLLIFVPWMLEGTPMGVVEVFQRPGASPETQEGYLKFVEAVAELAAEFCRNRLLRDYRHRIHNWTRLLKFTTQVHGTLDLRATAYAIANDGRCLLGCDRVTVLVGRGKRRYQAIAVSGVDTFRRRAVVVRRLEQLSRAVMTMGKPLWFPESKEDQTPQVEQALHAYLDESHARWLAVLPLDLPQDEKSPGPRRAVGVLVVEQFHGKLQERRQLLDAVCEHSALAISRAMEMEEVPLAQSLRKARRMLGLGRLTKIALVIGLLAAAVIALVRVRGDFTIEARGELQPRRMADVFALSDGMVSDLRVEHGQHVRAGQVLAVLRRPQLDFEFKQVWGELQTARKRLAGVEAEHIQIPRENEEQRRRYSQLTAQEEELRESIRNFEEQYAILQKKQSELEVRSPMEGEVLTWNLKQLLEDRPVNRGQALMTVGDLSGPWKLELRIPDRHVSHVLDAHRQTGKDLDVTYVPATDPRAALHGTIEEVCMRSEVAEGDEPYVMATVAIDRNEVPELTAGANVKAAIHCGRRALGYVWLHDLLDAIRTWFLF